MIFKSGNPQQKTYYSRSSFNALSVPALAYFAISQIALTLIKPLYRIKVNQLPADERFCLPAAISAKYSDTHQIEIDLSCPVALVTGSNTGIGYETALELVNQGYEVVLACRSREKGEAAVKKINEDTNTITRRRSDNITLLSFVSTATRGKAVFLHPLDLSSMSSVKEFSQVFEKKYNKLNILVNNAGINSNGLSADGLDLTFQTNFLGHFLLTNLLLNTLKNATNYYLDGSSEQGRIVNLSSVMHHFASGHENEAGWAKCFEYDGKSTYGDSKLAALLFTLELNRRFGNKADGIKSVAVNPGAVNSDIWRDSSSLVRNMVFRILYLDNFQGSRTTVAGAMSRLNTNDIYIQPYAQIRMNNKTPFPVFEMLGPYCGFAFTKPRLQSDEKAYNKSASSLWAICEAYTAQFR